MTAVAAVLAVETAVVLLRPVEDIEADHASFRARDVDVDAEIAHGKEQLGAHLDGGRHSGSRAAAVLLP